MFFVSLLLIAAAEVGAFVAVAEQIGVLWAFVILVVVSMLGPYLVRRVGVAVLAQTRQRLARGEVPTRELLDGLLILIGGVLICIPGFIGDACGLLLMIGPVRHFVIQLCGRSLARRLQQVPPGRWRFADARSRSIPAAPSRRRGPPPPPPSSLAAGEASER